MKTIKLNDQVIEYDETLTYADFYYVGEQAYKVELNWEALTDWDAVKEFIFEWSRWYYEAPRKRFYRDLIKSGKHVLSTECFFPEEDGDKFIDALENTGKLARKICELLNTEPMKPIKNDSQSTIPLERLREFT